MKNICYVIIFILAMVTSGTVFADPDVDPNHPIWSPELAAEANTQAIVAEEPQIKRCELCDIAAGSATENLNDARGGNPGQVPTEAGVSQ